MIQFLLNQEKVVLQDQPVDTTVLNFLRNDRNMCGTKEGCASGDCGACTVVLGERTGKQLRYRSINSCITFIGALQGKQLITIEHLARGQKLHPVQQAMVDMHGSQCGYCTPGFIMSMFAMYKSEEQSGNTLDSLQLKHKVDRYLGGNLCRCTGYQPIIKSTLTCMNAIAGDQFSQSQDVTATALLEMEQTVSSSNSAFSFHPDCVESLASSIRAYPQVPLIAGGTDLALAVTQDLQTIPEMIYLGGVRELNAVTHSDRHIEIGSAVSLNQCQNEIGLLFPETIELFDRFGSQQIRNQGTIGGNIANASPIGDLPPLLIALGASLRLQRDEEIREIPIEAFFIDYKKTALEEREFIRSILIPNPSPQLKLRVYKVSKRYDDDISAVCMAIAVNLSVNDALEMTDVRIGLGGMDAIPRRATQCEIALTNSELSKSTIENAAVAIRSDFEPISDARASAAYRSTISQNLLTRFYLELKRPQIQTRVVRSHE